MNQTFFIRMNSTQDFLYKYFLHAYKKEKKNAFYMNEIRNTFSLFFFSFFPSTIIYLLLFVVFFTNCC